MADPREQARLKALQAYQILDTAPEQVYDDLVRLAAHVCGTPMAVLTLVDERRQWFKAAVGMPIRESARSLSFCTYTIESEDPFIVPDAGQDPLFADNPLVTGEPGIRFYAGVPLGSSFGLRLGSLAVLDRVPRELTPEQLALLTALARQGMSLLELRLQRQELRLTRRRLNDAQRMARLGSWELALPSGLLHWSDEMYRIFGLVPDQFAATYEAFLAAVHPEDRERVDQEQRRILEAGGRLELDHRIVRPDGSISWVHVCSELERDATGQPVRQIGTMLDITDRQAADAEKQKLMRIEQQLLRTQRMESLGTLAGGIAHDLNNVLAPIMVSLELLRLDERDPERLTVLSSLEDSARRGAELVRQVLSFARGIEGERVLTNLHHLARELRQIIRETFPKNLEVRLASAPDLWQVYADPTQMHQVMMNLCVNARDAMPQGGRLTLALDNLMVDEIYAGMNPDAKPGPYVRITVEDTGSGIPTRIQERIFEPFFTTKEFGKGTGLGLATVLTIVRSHGGFINLYSEPGKGAKFKVYLPAGAAPESGERPAAEPARLPRGQGELVLVVDDEEGIRGATQKTLERFGYRVLLAAHGAEAVALYAERGAEIAAVLTDMAMPVMDGPATILALKAMNPAVRIIGSSGHASQGGVAKAVGAGVQHFVPKPYTAETLLKVLADVLAQPA